MMCSKFNGLPSKEVLDCISYTSTLPKSLKTISLSGTPLETILADIRKYRRRYFEMVVMQGNVTGSRFKSEDSITRKYAKMLNGKGGFKQCFNDVLSFRLRLDEYPADIPEFYRVVDLRNGKSVDDGYRAVHLYYQRDNKSYPIEVQLWCGIDYDFNLWSHRHIYKYVEPSIGKQLHDMYLAGEIRNESDFVAELERLDGSDADGK